MLMLVVFLVRIPLNQDCWFELTIIRTTRVNRIADHMSAVFVQLLGLFFGGEGQDLELGGLTVEFVDGASATIFADVLFSIADEAALHAMYGCKGSSGVKICCCCTNVFNANTPRRIVEADRSGQSVYHHCTDPTKFKRITPAVLDAIVRRLLRARPSELADLETDLGWKLQPHGIMFRPTARRRMCPSNKLCYDWAHIFMVNGLWNFVVCKVLLKFREHDIKPPVISTYVESFSWPAGTVATGHPCKVFSADRIKSSLAAKTLKCTASEGLSLVPVLGQFCLNIRKTHPVQTVREHAHCCELLCKVLGMLMRSFRGLLDGARLRDRILEFADRFIVLFGLAAATPKFHYMFHLLDYALILNCLVHERKHKGIKRFANNMCNTSDCFDGSILREVTYWHLAKLKDAPMIQFSNAAMLDGGRCPSAKLHKQLTDMIGDFPKDAIFVARCARVNRYEKVSVSDIVQVGTSEPPVIGKVEYHIEVRAEGECHCITILQEFAVESAHERCWKCRKLDSLTIVETHTIHCALIWGGNLDSVVTVLRPLHATASPDI